ncbi:MAG: peptidylprolyl isomerase [Alphaproteobacteria bacterium]|jgi:cyclophilin family peptidyl-prolyl cis-trans isomerase|nr:peptidylprolyl isomerase [Alphaproteobacteria bacterium]
MRPDLAPRHVARLRELVRRGFYDGLAFHNVVHDFVAETGEAKGPDRAGSDERIPAEFTTTEFDRGSVGMMRDRNDPDSAISRFFILYQPAPHLKGRYTYWGRVVHGMRYLDRLQPGNPPKRPDRIVRIRVLADILG